MANHGGGIYLDPNVWAVTPEEEAERRRARGTHVLNPATNRLERLDLSTALLGAGAGGHTPLNPLAAAPPVEEQPANVDLIGTARGRCRGCQRCAGYVRRPVIEGEMENQNDLTVLNCHHCGCAATEHEPL